MEERTGPNQDPGNVSVYRHRTLSIDTHSAVCVCVRERLLSYTHKHTNKNTHVHK
ncbi:hypothetical protein ANANG_G00282490, partial [Anguilla anguilla]